MKAFAYEAGTKPGALGLPAIMRPGRRRRRGVGVGGLVHPLCEWSRACSRVLRSRCCLRCVFPIAWGTVLLAAGERPGAAGADGFGDVGRPHAGAVPGRVCADAGPLDLRRAARCFCCPRRRGCCSEWAPHRRCLSGRKARQLENLPKKKGAKDESQRTRHQSATGSKRLAPVARGRAPCLVLLSKRRRDTASKAGRIERRFAVLHAGRGRAGWRRCP